MTIDHYIAIVAVLLIPWALLVGWGCYRLGRFVQRLDRADLYLVVARTVARVRRVPRAVDRWLDRVEGAAFDEAFR